MPSLSSKDELWGSTAPKRGGETVSFLEGVRAPLLTIKPGKEPHFRASVRSQEEGDSQGLEVAQGYMSSHL